MLDFNPKEIKSKVLSRFTEDLSIFLFIYKIKVSSELDFKKVDDLSMILS